MFRNLVILLNLQSTQRGFYVFHFTTMDKINLAQTIALQVLGRGDCPLSPQRDRQQGGSCDGPCLKIIVLLHI